MIHCTAIVDPKTELDPGVAVGPYALVEGPVVIGPGTEIQGHAVVSGSVRIGKNNRVGYGAVIGSFPQDLSFNPKASSAVGRKSHCSADSAVSVRRSPLYEREMPLHRLSERSDYDAAVAPNGLVARGITP
jgi:acyl-[acyl carrier protein]--UDP-N-acetylglucosamine O-acyltransferase